MLAADTEEPWCGLFTIPTWGVEYGPYPPVGGCALCIRRFEHAYYVEVL